MNQSIASCLAGSGFSLSVYLKCESYGWGLEEAFAEVDSVFEEGFEAAAHLGPAHAVAVGAVEAALGLAPAGFDDADEGVVGVEGLEDHLHRGFVVSGTRWFV